MADVIDEKVVSMQFDNKQFEKGVAESLKSIQELKDSLDFDKSVKNLDALAQAGKKFDFSGVSNAVDTVKEKFSALEIAGVTALVNITNQAVNAGKNMAAALTIDPIKVGLSTYEQKLNSVQTIMNNSGKSLAETNKILNALNDYSDKTIFSLSDMTTALGKFTAAGIDAADAVTIIKGAANEAATMGAGSAEFSRFIYNLSQAYSVGKMTMIDWKSLENAGIAGVKFKQTLVDAARELGTINDEFEKKHGVVTATNLREFLKEGIITNEVMTKAFNLYADTTTDFGRAAEAAATQIKTFHQLLDVLKESVASKWSQAWTYIIGDFNEAKKLWTGVSALFEATLGKINDNRNQLLKLWHEGFRDPATDKTISGRKYLLDGIANILQSIARLIKPVKDAFREIFPAKTAQNLWEATKAFSEFTAKMRISSGAMKQIKDFAAGIFSVMRLVRDTFWDVIKAIFPATEGINGMLGLILRLAGAFGRWLQSVTTAIRENEAYRDTIKAIGSSVLTVVKIVAILAKTLFNVAKAAKEMGLLQKAFGLLAGVVTSLLSTVMKYGPKVLNILGGIASVFIGLVGLIGKGIAGIGNFFVKLFSKKDGRESARAITSVAEAYELLGPELARSMMNAGVDVSKGFSVGLLKSAGIIATVLSAVFGQGVVGTVYKIFGIASPSKVFIAIGSFCLAGLLIGLTNPAIRAQIQQALTDFANSGIIQWFKNALVKGFNGIAYVWRGAADGIVYVVKNISAKIQGLAGETSGLAARIGDLFNFMINGLKNLNGAAMLLTLTVGAAIVVVVKLFSTIVNITSFFKTVGGGFLNITNAFKNTAKGFKKMAKAFFRQQNPIVNTLRGIALSILAITTSLLVLSSVEDKNSLWTSAAVLAGSLLAIVALLTAAAQRVKAADLEDSVNKVSMMLLSVAGSLFILTFTLSSMTSTISGLNGDLTPLLYGLATIAGVGAIMYGFVELISKIPFTEGVKSAIVMLSFSIIMARCVKSLKKLTEIEHFENIEGAMVALGVILAAIAGVSLAVRGISWGGLFTLLAISILVKTIVYAIAEVEWTGVMGQLQKYQDVIAKILVVITLMAVGAAYLGQGLKNFGEGMRELGISLLAMAAAIGILKYIQADVNDIVKLTGVLIELAGMLVIVMLVCKYCDIPQEDMTQLGKLMQTLGMVMIEMAAAVAIAKKFGADQNVLMGMGLAIIAFMGGIALITSQLDHARGDNDLHDLAKFIKSFTLPIIALSLLAKVYQGSTAGDVAAVIFSLIGVFAGIAVICTMVGNAKEEDVAYMKKLTALLLVVVGDLILLSMIPYERLLMAMASLTVSLLSIYLIVKAMKDVRAESLKPLISAAAMLVIVGASLTVMAKMCDWENILSAAGAMSITMIAVATALRIMTGSNAGNAIAAAAAILIASASLIVIGYALSKLVAVDWTTVWQAAACIGVLTAALAILGAVGPTAIVGAVGLVIAAASLTIIGNAMQSFMAIDWGDGVGKMAACIGILTAIVAIFGIFAPIATAGAIGLIIASVGLIAVAKAMQMFSEATVGGGYLSGIAGGLMLLGIAGVILAAGAPGLIAGGIGMLILASGLRILSGVDTKVVNGKTLTGISAGLMMLGLAGVVLGLGAAGLIIGGIGLVILAGGLALMDNLNYKALSKKNLIGLGEGLIKIATAGIVGIIGGPGLILLSVGLTALAGAITVVGLAIEGLLGLMKVVGDVESVNIGANVVAGMIKGMTSMTGALMSSITFIFGGMLNGIRAFLGIHSPSTALEELGEWTGLGFLKGWAKSDLVQKLDKVSESIATDGILKPLTSTLSEGFGNIGDIFSGADFGFGDLFKSDTAALEKELEQQKKQYNDLIKGRYSFYRKNPTAKAQENYERRIGTVAQRIAELERKIAESESNSVDGLFGGLSNGVDGLAEMFDGLKDALNGTDFEMSGMSVDAASLAGSMGDLNAASAATTKTFAENMDIFSDFDRSLKTTVNDIESNMINQLLGTDQWAKYLNNLRAYGYDPQLIAEIADKGMQSGYNIAAALNAAGSNYEKVKEINDIYNKGKHEYAEAAQKAEEDAKNLAKSGAKAEQNLKDVVVTSDMMNGDISKISNNLENQDVLKELLGQGYEEYLEGAKFEDYLKRLQGDQAATEKLREEQEAAQEKANQTTADAMMKELANAIENAVNKYLPASEFVKIGENICLGLTAGIIMGKGMTVNEVINLCELLKKSAMGTLDEHSPSKVFKQIGNYCVEGLALGLQDSTDATKSARYLSQNLIDEMNEQLAKIQKLIESDEVWSPTIKPVVDLSNMPSNMLDFGFDTSHIRAAAQSLSGFEIGAKAPADTMASMSKSDFARFLNDFANTIVDGINNGERTITVPITIKNDPHKQFTAMVDENNAYKHATGYSAFV